MFSFINYDTLFLDISKLDTSNIINMSGMFYQSKGDFPDISNWDTSNVINMAEMFRLFEGKIPDISKWDT